MNPPFNGQKIPNDCPKDKKILIKQKVFILWNT